MQRLIHMHTIRHVRPIHAVNDQTRTADDQMHDPATLFPSMPVHSTDPVGKQPPEPGNEPILIRHHP